MYHQSIDNISCTSITSQLLWIAILNSCQCFHKACVAFLLITWAIRAMTNNWCEWGVIKGLMAYILFPFWQQENLNLRVVRMHLHPVINECSYFFSTYLQSTQYVSEGGIPQTICSASRKQMNILWGNFKSHSKPRKYFYTASNKEYLWEFNKFSSVVGKWRKDFINFPVCATSMPHIIHGLCRKELPTRLSIVQASFVQILEGFCQTSTNDDHWYSMFRSHILPVLQFC